MIGVHVHGDLLPNLLLDFHRVFPLYPVYQIHFSFTPYDYDGFMTWIYGGFMPIYNGILMTCPYFPVTIVSTLFVLSAILSCREVK